MTHDDLLDKINEASMYANGNVEPALRAVVELHKPNANDYQGTICSHCNMYEYPCPTIQAIEKALA